MTPKLMAKNSKQLKNSRCVKWNLNNHKYTKIVDIKCNCIYEKLKMPFLS